MPTRISRALGVSEKALHKLGAFDGFIDIDARFYVDPSLLQIAKTQELSGSHVTFRKYFANVLRLLDASSRKGDLFYRQAARMLAFKELKVLSLGYSRGGVDGSGIGKQIANQVADTAYEIVRAGIKDPAIFELIGLFQDNIGADRISDMTCRVIYDSLLSFSQRVARDLGLETFPYSASDKTYRLARVKSRPVVLMPKEILTPLPVAYDWSDIDYVAAHNNALRSKVNRIIGDTWRYATRRIPKGELRRVLLRNPELIRDLISQYGNKQPIVYNFEKDPYGEIIWADISDDYATQYPLSLVRPANHNQALEVVIAICARFGQLVESNGLHQLLYDEQKDLRNERFAQLLFFGIADCYCEANGLDLNREPNAGRGPVDFKVSRGYEVRVAVEVKYSSNTRLVHGYMKQLPIYEAAEQTQHSVYLIIRTKKAVTAIEEVARLEREMLDQGRRAPRVIVVDGRLMPPASRA